VLACCIDNLFVPFWPVHLSQIPRRCWWAAWFAAPHVFGMEMRKRIGLYLPLLLLSREKLL
jgi:hypothetical protein